MGRRLRTCRSMLRRGFYLRAGLTTWRHWRTPLPGHLRATKVSLPSSGALGRDRGPSRAARSLPFIYLPVFTVWRKGSDNYPIVIAPSGRGILLLDPQAGRVARNYPTRHLSEGQIQLRERWGSVVPSPSFSADPRTGWLTEEYVEGEPLDALPQERQRRCVRDLIRSYSHLVSTRSEPARASLTDIPDGVLLDQAERLAVFAHLRRPQVRAWLEAVPLVPTPVDYAAANVIVPATGAPRIIDSIPLAWLPVYYTPLALIAANSTTAPLRAEYFAGTFDPELEELFHAGGVSYRTDLPSREALVAMCCLSYASARDARIGAQGQRIGEFLRQMLSAAGLSAPASWPSYGDHHQSH